MADWDKATKPRSMFSRQLCMECHLLGGTSLHAALQKKFRNPHPPQHSCAVILNPRPLDHCHLYGLCLWSVAAGICEKQMVLQIQH